MIGSISFFFSQITAIGGTAATKKYQLLKRLKPSVVKITRDATCVMSEVVVICIQLRPTYQTRCEAELAEVVIYHLKPWTC